MLLCRITLAGARSALTKKPSNVVVRAGTNITLECSSDASASSIGWLHDLVAVTRSGSCTAKDHARYVTKSTVNDCYLTAVGNYSVQGPYLCHDGNENAEAVAIVIGNFDLLLLKRMVNL